MTKLERRPTKKVAGRRARLDELGIKTQEQHDAFNGIQRTIRNQMSDLFRVELLNLLNAVIDNGELDIDGTDLALVNTQTWYVGSSGRASDGLTLQADYWPAELLTPVIELAKARGFLFRLRPTTEPTDYEGNPTIAGHFSPPQLTTEQERDAASEAVRRNPVDVSVATE